MRFVRTVVLVALALLCWALGPLVAGLAALTLLHPRVRHWMRPSRRVVLGGGVAVVALAALVWLVPHVIALTPLRDEPLRLAFAGIDGRLASRSASWAWSRGIEYRDIVLYDRGDRPVVVVRAAEVVSRVQVREERVVVQVGHEDLQRVELLFRGPRDQL